MVDESFLEVHIQPIVEDSKIVDGCRWLYSMVVFNDCICRWLA